MSKSRQGEMISNSAESFDSETFGLSEDDSAEMDHSQDSENGKLSRQSYLSANGPHLALAY
jgi:hypothetical protein